MTIKFLAGVDEVGRGCLAGPVMSAAIILNNKIDKKILVDSKTISHKKRCKLANYIILNSELGDEVARFFCASCVFIKIYRDNHMLTSDHP